MTFWGFAAEHPAEFFFCVIAVCIALVRIVYHLRNPNSTRKRTVEDGPKEGKEE